MIKIIVDGQSLRWYDRAPKVAADSVEFVKFKFLLSEEWDDHVVVAQFSQKGATYNKVLEDGCCTLPVEIEDGKCFISIFGQIPGGPERATVIPLLTDVSLSGFVGNGKTSIPPTPDLYSQLIDYFSKNSSGGAGAVDPEDIAQAVEDYLTEHPIKESYSTTTEITDESTNEEVPTAAAVRTYVSQHFGSSTELFIVTVRRNTSGATADKTSKEVYEAYTQGKIPYCHLIDVVADLVLDMPFTGGGDVLCYFANTIGGLNYFVSIQDATAAVTVTELLASDKLTEAVEDALTQAKESGEFDGDDYVLTEDDKLEIAEQVSKLSGGNAVQYIEQELTPEQQAQARENIGAASAEDMEAIKDMTAPAEGSANILPPDTLENYYYNTNSGALTEHSAYMCTPSMIPVGDHSMLYITWSEALNLIPLTDGVMIIVSFYTSDGTYVGQRNAYCGTNGGNTEKFIANFSDMSNVAFFNVSVRRGSANSGKLTMEDICVSYFRENAYEPYIKPGGLVLKSESIGADTMKMFAPLHGKTIVNFGDSIFGKRRPPDDISTELAALTGATVHNCGFGGCHMSNHWTSTYSAFSMCNLADAIVSGDWTAQETAIADTSSSAVPSYFSEALGILKSLDFSNVDIITIAYGTNDFTRGDLLDDDDTLSKDTFAGALRYSIEKLLTAYPNLKIFICSQTYRFWVDDSNAFTDDSDTHTVNDKKLTDFVAKTKAVAEEYHLPYIDNYYGLGFNKFNRSQYFSETDGTHPLTTGCHVIAAHIARSLF